MSMRASSAGDHKAAPPPPVIVWNEGSCRFETEDKEAYLQYRLLDSTVMDMVHTFVPRTKRGLGIAGILTAAAFNHAKQHSMFVIPTCSYISDTFLPKNPEWGSIVYGKEKKSSM